MATSDKTLLPPAADLLGPARSRPQPSGLLSSFWMAAYESACHINGRGERLDMIAATQHDRFLDDDYAPLRSVGMSVARDTVRWHLVERPGGTYDLSSVATMLAAAQRQQAQIVWDLCHCGWPRYASRPRSSSASHASAA